MPTIDISRLMRPRSIAIVGISPEPSSAGFLMLKTLEEYSYSGAIHLVSRNRSDVAGRPCVKTIEDLPDGVDAAMLLIPRVAIEEAVKSCAKKNIGGIVIFAAGFGEAGGEWKAAQDRIAAIAEENGIALCGPNCLGLVDFIHRIPLTFSQQLGPVLDVEFGRRRRGAKRRACRRGARRAARQGHSRHLLGLDRQRGRARPRGLRRLSPRGEDDAGRRLLRRADPQAAAFPRSGCARARDSASRSCCCMPARARRHRNWRDRIPARWSAITR